MLGLGIDFGTSNSSVACFDGETLALLPLDPAAEAPQVTPTALYLDRERRGRVGQQAIDTYLRENAGRSVTLSREEIGQIEITTSGGELIQGPKEDGGAITTPVRVHAFTDRELPGRLFRGLKRRLGNEDLDRVSVFGGRYRIVALVTPILKQLADATADSDIELARDLCSPREISGGNTRAGRGHPGRRVQSAAESCSNRVMRFAGALATGLALFGCVSYGQHADRVREQLVGLPARHLNQCIGAPVSVDPDGEVEYLTFRWQLTVARNGQATVRPIGPEEFRRRRSPSLRRGDPSRFPDEGYCELVFELRDRTVRAVRVEGRTQNGLNADAQCILLAERCLPSARERR